MRHVIYFEQICMWFCPLKLGKRYNNKQRFKCFVVEIHNIVLTCSKTHRTKRLFIYDTSQHLIWSPTLMILEGSNSRRYIEHD